MSVGEMTAAMKASGSAEATGDERGEGLAYDVRFRRVVDARVEFDAELLEAEALWGAEIRQRGDALNAITGELQGSLARWLNRTRRQMDPDREERVCGVIYDDDTNYSAEFSQKVKEAFEAFEKLIRPHLKL
jgi:hypothetical protein